MNRKRHGEDVFKVNGPIETKLPIVREFFEYTEKLGISLFSIGQKSGFDTATISSWRRGRHNPRLSEFMTVCEAIGFKLELRPMKIAISQDGFIFRGNEQIGVWEDGEIFIDGVNIGNAEHRATVVEIVSRYLAKKG